MGSKEGYLEVKEPLEIIGKSDVCTWVLLSDSEWVSTSLKPPPFNTAPHAVLTPNITLFLLLLITVIVLLLGLIM